ncbi:hypothetical protein COOONC_28239 [Cooperia oncophora]
MAEEAGLSPAELKQMLPGDTTTAEQLSSMKESLESLMRKVDSLTARGSQQEPRQAAGAECSRTAPPIVYEQLDVGDFDNVEYSGFRSNSGGASKKGRPSAGRGPGTRANRRRLGAKAKMKAYLDLITLKDMEA